MRPTAMVKLSRLREIGWSLWDPIGLDGSPADEYDTYLLQAVGRLRRGQAHSAVARYLEGIEVRHMGLNRNGTRSQRAEATVRAIGEYLATLPAGPLGVR